MTVDSTAWVSGLLVDDTEVGECACFPVADAMFAGQRQGCPVVVGGLSASANASIDGAQVVQGRSVITLIFEIAPKRQGLLVQMDSFLVLTGPGVDDRNVAHCPSLAD